MRKTKLMMIDLMCLNAIYIYIYICVDVMVSSLLDDIPHPPSKTPDIRGKAKDKFEISHHMMKA